MELLAWYICLFLSLELRNHCKSLIIYFSHFYDVHFQQNNTWLDYFYTIDKFLICYHLVFSYHYVTAHATLFHQFQILNMNKSLFRLIIWFNYSTWITFFYILNSILLGRFNCTWPPCIFLINLLSLTFCILYEQGVYKLQVIVLWELYFIPGPQGLW